MTKTEEDVGALRRHPLLIAKLVSRNNKLGINYEMD